MRYLARQAVPALPGALVGSVATAVAAPPARRQPFEGRRGRAPLPLVAVSAARTRLTPEPAAAARGWPLVRGHWGSEQRSHWGRAGPFDEERSQVRTQAAPPVLAALRQHAISPAPGYAAWLRGDCREAAYPRRAPTSCRPARPLWTTLLKRPCISLANLLTGAGPAGHTVGCGQLDAPLRQRITPDTAV
jgi:hypothetical protein